MNQYNQTTDILKSLLGDKYPQGASSMSTTGNVATFCIGKTGQLVDVQLDDRLMKQFEEFKLFGSFGFDLTCLAYDN